MNIYVGNLPWSTTEDEVRDLFEEFGDITSLKMINDRETGRFKGFAFVEMSGDNEAQSAIEALDGREVNGRNLRVNEARPREDRSNQRGRGGFNRGSGRW